MVGSSIEWYDFFIYGTAAALVFGKLYFPYSSPLMGTLLAFATFWAGFLARPIGALVFGHIGDSIGRKPALVACLTLATTATCLVVVLPTEDVIGVTAPILLVVLRFVQGIGVGGQWGGVTVLLTETTTPDRKGQAGAFGQVGVPAGVLLANGAFLTTAALLSDEQFLTWGWRIPFLVSIVLYPVVLFIQLRVEDSPVFREFQERGRQRQEVLPSAPIVEAIRTQPKRILLGAGILFSSNAIFYISVSGVLDYATRELGMARGDLLLVSLLGAAIGVPIIFASGALSDRIGRRPPMLLGAAMMAVWAFPYFWLVDTAWLPAVGI